MNQNSRDAIALVKAALDGGAIRLQGAVGASDKAKRGEQDGEYISALLKKVSDAVQALP